MKTGRPAICPPPRVPVGGSEYGPIACHDAPVQIAAGTTTAVGRHAIRILAHVLSDAGSLAGDAPGLTDPHRLPDPDAPITAIDGWLTLLRRVTAIPGFAVLDDEAVIVQ